MARYRFLLADVPAGTIIGEAPFERTAYSHELNGPGTVDGTMSLRQAPAVLATLSPALASVGALALHVERDGVIVWSGPVWGWHANLGASTMALQGQGWHSYFRRRVLAARKTFTQFDQTSIAANLISTAQVEGDSVNLGIITDHTLTGVLRDRTWEAYERKNIGEAVEQLAAVRDGFDWRYDTAWEGDQVVTRWHTFFPATGRQTSLVFEAGRGVSGVTVRADTSALATHAHAVGAGQGDARLLATVSDPALLGAYPQLDQVTTVADVSVQATLDDHARRLLDRGHAPILHVTLDADPGHDPKLGAYAVGDVVTVRAREGLLAIDGRYRLVSQHVTIGVDGAETARLDFAGAEVFA